MNGNGCIQSALTTPFGHAQLVFFAAFFADFLANNNFIIQNVYRSSKAEMKLEPFRGLERGLPYSSLEKLL